MKQFAILKPNNIVVDVTNIAYILRQDLNRYVIVPKRTVSPNVPSLDGNEFDALVKFITDGGEGEVLTVQKAEEAPKLATA